MIFRIGVGLVGLTGSIVGASALFLVLLSLIVVAAALTHFVGIN